MADGTITFSTELDNKELEKQLQSLKKKIASIEDGISQKKAEKFSLLKQTEQLTANLDAAKAKLYEMQSGKEFYPAAAIQEQAATVKALQADWDKVQKQVEQYEAAIKNANINLDRQKEKAGAIEKELAAAGANSEKMADATKKAHKSMGKFSMRLREVIRSALVFTVITQTLAKFRDWMGKVVKTNEEATAAVAKLKGALLTLVQPLVDVIVPAFTALTNVLTQITTVAARMMAALFGTTVDKSKEAAENLYNETEAIEETGEAAKEAAKSMASFDEINQLSGDGKTGTEAVENKKDEIKPDFSAFDSLNYKEKLDEITAYVSGALLAVGAILAFSGINIPLGITLMALGAAGLAGEIAENWGAMDKKLKDAITTVLITLGAAALVIGAILAFSGANIPLGIALMVVGAAALCGAATLNWRELDDETRNAITTLLIIVGGALLAIGAVLAFSGANIPLGIGLMAAGALILAGAAVLNWRELSENVRSALTALLIFVGSMALVIGAVLAFSGTNVPLGIGLMILGATSLTAAAVLNWESLKGSVVQAVSVILGVLGGALLAVGAVFAFSGVRIALGIALMAVGAAAIAGAVTLNWNGLSNNISDIITLILGIVGGAALALGAILALSGVNIPLGIALLVAGGAALASAGVVNWDSVLDMLKGAWEHIKNWWSTNVAKYFTLEYWTELGSSVVDGIMAGLESIFQKLTDWGASVKDAIKSFFGFDASSASSYSTGGGRGVTAYSGMPTLPANLPRLATGAVIPPNREFMAVLGDQKSGTNIEAPLETMVQAFKQAASEMNMGGKGDITVIMELDGRQFGRASYKYFNQESQRVGVSLVEK